MSHGMAGCGKCSQASMEDNMTLLAGLLLSPLERDLEPGLFAASMLFSGHIPGLSTRYAFLSVG
jgi:hypothetical protein